MQLSQIDQDRIARNRDEAMAHTSGFEVVDAPLRRLDREYVRDQFRTAVLAALDETARTTFIRSTANSGTEGASDGDLPTIFATLDAHVDALAERHGYTLSDK